MLSPLLKATKEDAGAIGNYILDEARKNGSSASSKAISTSIDYALEKLECYKIEDDDAIIAFMIFNIEKNELWNFYIAEGYRRNRNVIIPMCNKLYDVFKGKILKYRKLYNDIDKNIKIANNGKIIVDNYKRKKIWVAKHTQ